MKNIPKFVWWIIGIAAVILVAVFIYSNRNKNKNSKSSERRTNRNAQLRSLGIDLDNPPPNMPESCYSAIWCAQQGENCSQAAFNYYWKRCQADLSAARPVAPGYAQGVAPGYAPGVAPGVVSGGRPAVASAESFPPSKK